MWGRPSPAKCTNSLLPQVRQSARDLLAETSARWLDQRSCDSMVRRKFLVSPTRSLIASDAATEAARLTAEFRMPEVSQVSTVPRGLSGKMQLRHAVSPGRMFIVVA